MKLLVTVFVLALIPESGIGQIKQVYELPTYNERSDPDISVFLSKKKDTVYLVRVNKSEARGDYYWSRSFYGQSKLWNNALTEYIDALRIHEITEEACDDCQELLSLINFRVGVCYYNLNQFAKGISYLTRSINLMKDGNFFLVKYPSRLRNASINPSDTSSYFVSPSELLFTETHAMVFIFRGSAKMRLQDYYGAEKDFKAGIKLDEREAYYMAYGEMLSNMKRHQDALNIFNKVLSTNPSSGDGYYLRGITRINLRDKIGGCQDLSKAGELGIEDAYRIIKENCNR